MRIQRKSSGFISNFKSSQPLLSALFVQAARALLCESALNFGGVGINDSEDRRIISDMSQYVLNKSTDFTSEHVEQVQNN